jgi:hypothetical protein
MTRYRRRILSRLALILALAATNPVLAADRPFNWDRYHDRLDACTETDRITAACARGYCDELALRQAQRACSPFSGSQERR